MNSLDKILILVFLLLNINQVHAVTSEDTIDCHTAFKNKEWDRAFEFCTKESSNDSTSAGSSQVNLGQLYYHGLGVTKDLTKAISLFKMASAVDANAKLFLAAMYFRGEGVPQDYREAFNLFKLAADQGHDVGQYHVGEMYYYGLGVEKNIKEAERYFRLVIAKPSASRRDDAFFALGTIYHFGLGGQVNYEEAMKFYRKPMSHDLAHHNMAILYRDGLGVEKNEKRAFTYFNGTAYNGLPQSQHVLGEVFLKGQLGMDKDLIRSYFWYSFAAAANHEGSLKAKKEIEKILTAKQLSIAKKNFDECKKDRTCNYLKEGGEFRK